MLTYTDQSIMPYGKYQGQKLANIPFGYWDWMKENGKLTDCLLKYYEANKDVFKAERERAHNDRLRREQMKRATWNYNKSKKRY